MICDSSFGLIYGITVLAAVCCGYFAAAEQADPLECYYCIEGSGPNITDPLPVCSQLQNTSNYRMKCPKSSMCLKRVISIDLTNGSKWTTEIRGCAMQFSKMPVRQKMPNGKFKIADVTDVKEIYETGCTSWKYDIQRTASIVECYCRGNLCNAAPATAAGDLITLVKIIYIILVMGLIMA